MIMAVGLHLGVLAGLLIGGNNGREERFEPLATMHFSNFDPEGGEAGGADSDDLASGGGPEPAPEDVQEDRPEEPEVMPAPVPEELSEKEPEPLPEEPEPLPEEIEENEEPEIVESVSEKADLVPPPPKPLEEPKPVKLKPKPKPRPKPKVQPPEKAVEAAPVAGLSGGGQGDGPKKQGGGGPGKGSGGIGGGKGSGNPDAMKAYISKVVRQLQRHKKYPQSARSQHIQGQVTVAFTVTRDGSVHSPRLAKSSGHKILDDEVMAMLRRASPMPPIPRELARDSVSLKVPIAFSIR